MLLSGTEAVEHMNQLLGDTPQCIYLVTQAHEYFGSRIEVATDDRLDYASILLTDDLARITLGHGKNRDPPALIHELLHIDLYLDYFPRPNRNGRDVQQVHGDLHNIVQHCVMLPTWLRLDLDQNDFVQRKNYSAGDCDLWLSKTRYVGVMAIKYLESYLNFVQTGDSKYIDWLRQCNSQLNRKYSALQVAFNQIDSWVEKGDYWSQHSYIGAFNELMALLSKEPIDGPENWEIRRQSA